MSASDSTCVRCRRDLGPGERTHIAHGGEAYPACRRCAREHASGTWVPTEHATPADTFTGP